ncbi:MAG: hypothetical protein OHK93_006062 [Ramalina farinacea]|uniref:Syntaxin n=1 Tax=Ramalina farinacea TaxID=258253 RepID=A0AA43QM31_9LECA|nr:hypothetical protein [Ramalina farinacea]
MSQPELSIPTTSTPPPSPHTLYNISLRLPLRSLTLPKRYSDFLALHTALLATSPSNPPPAPFPPKTYFTSTLTSPTLCATRRAALEHYLTTINTHPDSTWRSTPAWRTFLNLPSTATAKSGAASSAHNTLSAGGPVTDPTIWLDQHRNLKTLLHDARLALTRRDQANTTTTQHEAGAEAKKNLVRAGTMIAQLDRGLKDLGAGGWGANKLGEGEVRRRRDLLSAARREREGLENLLGAMKVALFGGDGGQGQGRGGGGGRSGGGRVLGGKETEKTKQLDNQGVLQLQQTMMGEQDEDVMVLAKAVARQKELGMQIQEELAVQNDMLDLLDEDVDRVQGKVDVARKRINKIS